jgi:PiT family inorganic phosphate transporter
MIDYLLLVGILTAIFVGINIGGSSTAVAWGPAVGAGVIRKTTAAVVMTFFVFIGGWTVGRNVIDTLGGEIVPQSMFTLEASIIVMFFIGFGMFVCNIFGVPISTSMSAVGAIAGYGLAIGTLNWEVMGRIVSWWVVTPVIAFWVGGVIGRYFYPYLDQYFALQQSEGPLVVLDRSNAVPRPALGPGTTTREFSSTVLVFVIGCYMAFSAGASNVANAVAPLIGGGAIGVDAGIVLATFAIALGSFTIARRTMDSVGHDVTALPLLAATVVMVTAATITTVLSWLGIPISLAISTVFTIIGLGWGRASRSVSARDAISGSRDVELSVSAIATETPENGVPAVGEEEPDDLQSAGELFNTTAVAKFIIFLIIGPTVALVGSYLFFIVIPFDVMP